MKAIISLVLAAACFGSALTAMALSSRLDDAADAVAKAIKQKIAAEDKLHEIAWQIEVLKEEKQLAVDMIPPNSQECWARFRRQEASGKPLASR